MVERALAEMEGRSTGATPGGGTRAGAPMSPILGSDKPGAAWGAAELLQEPAESRRPRGSSRYLSGEPGCWYYSCCDCETDGDGAEDIEWWLVALVMIRVRVRVRRRILMWALGGRDG
jgi:hypothetical protein